MVKWLPAFGVSEIEWNGLDKREKKRIQMKEYRSRPIVKENERKYRSRPDVQARKRERLKIYYAKPEVQQQVKEKTKAYLSRPDIKERERKRHQEYYASPEYQAKMIDASFKEKRNAATLKYSCRDMGMKTIDRFCRDLRKCMQFHTSKAKLTEPVEYSNDILYAIARRVNKFEIDDKRSFDLRWTNGYYNSVSIQRWDNTRGYSLNNTTPIPIMLQCRLSFTLEEFRRMPELMIDNTPMVLINEWREHFFKTVSMFYRRAYSISQRGKQFGFESAKHALIFLRNKFIEQGGLCAYSGLPMRLDSNTGSFMLSVERFNPILGYTSENIILICAGFNGPVFGRHGWFRKHEDGSEAHQIAVDNAKFNVKYWYDSMLYTPEVLTRIEEIRSHNREMMKSWMKYE